MVKAKNKNTYGVVARKQYQASFRPENIITYVKKN
jgi:hypothetical protein